MGRLYKNNFHLLNLKKYYMFNLKKKKERQNINNYDMEDVAKVKY